MPPTGDPSPPPGPQPASPEGPGTPELLAQLRHDRQWLLRQIDSGRWSAWRLDLAALERELGQLLELADQRLPSDAVSER
ncbi:MAG: hypothetical protein VKO00_09005 [Cyanobacteriota bacterium]|nr:hypothetical protein [Cyanobacteriota bacterium]